MRRLPFLAVAIALAVGFLPSSPGRAAREVPFIVDGIDAADEFGGYVARIITDDRRLCSGTFISPSWVLTAGHCIADRAEIFVGSTRVSRLVSKGGARGVRHPYYVEETAVPRYDFGLYQLDTPADLGGVTLPGLTNYDDLSEWAPGASVITLGWGLTEAEGSLSTVLQQATLTILDKSTCEDLDRSLGAVFDPTSSLCAKDTLASACNGDSGGPLLAVSASGVEEVVGVTSYGPEDCDGHSVYGWTPAGLAWVRSMTDLPLGSGSSASGSHTVTRIFGLDRYETSAAVGAFWDESDVVFVATGSKFPDALASGATAAAIGAPVLLVNSTSIPEATRYQIQRLAPSTIYVAGGPAAIDDGVVASLGAIVGSDVIRLGGIDRYETSDLLGGLVDDEHSGRRVWVASGRDFADPLVASTAAAIFGEPFVLIDGINPVPDRTRERLSALAPTKIVILGADASFAGTVRDSLNAIAPLQALTGGDATWRSSVVWGDIGSSDWLSLATVENFPDALAAVPYSSKGTPTPLMLVPKGCVPASVLDQVGRLGVDRVVLFGGPMALNESVENLQRC